MIVDLSKIPCICAHEQAAHVRLTGPCTHISYPFSKLRHSCGCPKFMRFTNLQWLEIQYAKKNAKREKR